MEIMVDLQPSSHGCDVAALVCMAVCKAFDVEPNKALMVGGAHSAHAAYGVTFVVTDSNG